MTSANVPAEWPRPGRERLILLATLALLSAPGCASGRGVPPADAQPPVTPPAPAVDSALVGRLTRNTAPAVPQQILFDWSLQDRDVRVQGRGVLRVQAPYHARLDLFGPQDVEFVRAVLVHDSLDYRAAARDVPLPPVAFLWSLLGVFRAPGAAPGGMTGTASDFTLLYETAGESWQFRADTTALRRVEWLGADGGRRTVELTGPFRAGRPTRAVFREWRDFRELTLNVTTMETVTPFDPGIWNVSIQ